jgi:hypothetical protein
VNPVCGWTFCGLENGRRGRITAINQLRQTIVETKKSIALLNNGVADELQAVHQYLYWHFHLDDQGFGPSYRALQSFNQAPAQAEPAAE